jgi:hypothetical protein
MAIAATAAQLLGRGSQLYIASASREVVGKVPTERQSALEPLASFSDHPLAARRASPFLLLN